MKIQIKITFTILIIMIGSSFNKINSQSSTIGHFVPGFPAFNWCGWDAVTPIPFNLEHRGNQDINFLTNSVQRMTVKGSSFVNPGFVGIGNGFTNPQSLLHIDDGFNSYLQVTNAGSGPLANDGVKFGLFGNTPNAIIAQQENFRLFFTTGGSNLASIRMCVLGATGPIATFGATGAGVNLQHTT